MLLDEPIAPAGKRRIGISSEIFAGRPVKTQIADPACRPARGSYPRKVVANEPCTMTIKQRSGFIDIPALMAKLEHMREIGRQRAEEGLEPVEIYPKGGWQLIKYGAEHRLQVNCLRHHSGDGFGAVLELLGLGDETVGLYRITEARRRLPSPGVEGLSLGKPVEAVVDLYRIELGGIELEPSLHRKPGRIEGASPVPIVPPRTADPYVRTK